MSKRLPSILEQMIDEANRGLRNEPSYQCQAGFCGQCSCNERDINARYGEWEYIVEPSLPPFEDKVLPCISRQKVAALTPDNIAFQTLMSRTNGTINIAKKLMAKRASVSELGKFSPGSMSPLTEESIILRTIDKKSDGTYSYKITDASAFQSSFGRLPLPGVGFTLFQKTVKKACVVLDSEMMGSFPSNPNGKKFFAQNERFTIEVEEGDIITSGGVLIDRSDALKVSLKVDIEPNASLTFDITL
jgi:hypothetical protein